MAAAFLVKADFITIITVVALDNLTDATDSTLDEMAAEACEEMKAFLIDRYDVVAIFTAAGSARNKLILMYGKDITLYHLHSRHHLRLMPAIRLKRYQNALQWLSDVNAQKINPVGLPLLADTVSTLVKTGGNLKRINQQQ